MMIRVLIAALCLMVASTASAQTPQLSCDELIERVGAAHAWADLTHQQTLISLRAAQVEAARLRLELEQAKRELETLKKPKEMK